MPALAPTNRGEPPNPGGRDSWESDYTLSEFLSEFPDEEACLQWLWRARLSPDGRHAHCRRCGRERPFKRYRTAQRRQSWTCTACGLHLQPRAGTIFESSRTPLELWFYAFYLIAATGAGISAKQLQRELGVGYKTALRIFNLIAGTLMGREGARATAPAGDPVQAG